MSYTNNLLAPVQPILALLPNAKHQVKEQLVLILESLKNDVAGDQTQTSQIWCSTCLPYQDHIDFGSCSVESLNLHKICFGEKVKKIT